MKAQTQVYPSRGFTLVELMVTMTIVGLAMAGITTFFIDSSRVLFTSEAKNEINQDIRKLTNEMTLEARNANYFAIYEAFNKDMRKVSADVDKDDPSYFDPNNWYIGVVTDWEFEQGQVPLSEEAVPDEIEPRSFFRKRDGQSGDFLILVTYGDDLVPYDTPDGLKHPHDRDYTKPIKRIIGYYRSVENDEEQTGPVRKFEVLPQGDDRFKNIEELLPSPENASSYPVVVELSRGLANKRLFYNFRDRSVMVNGQIYHGNAAKEVTDTYNFTISPRG